MINNIKCCVLLSTYNGKKYLPELLQSLYAQTIRNDVVVYVRDDGSSDNTCMIIKDFQDSHPELVIKLVEAENIGVQKSFLELMRTAPEAQYYAFCDQDDFWKPEKLETACRELDKCDGVALYYSDYDVVDASLNWISKSRNAELGPGDSITQILYQNRIPGCVMVFNTELLRRVNVIHIDEVRMHDVFALAVAYLTGKILSDNKALVMYRQHGDNVVGHNKKYGFKKWIKLKLKLLKNGDGYHMEDTADALVESCANDCTKEQIQELLLISKCRNSFPARVKLAFSSRTTSETNYRATISVKAKILLHLM